MKSLNGFCLLCILGVLALGTTTGLLSLQGQEQQTYEIKITPNADPEGPPAIDPEDQGIGPNDEVVWVCTTACDFTVVFTEPRRKPFKNRTFGKGNNRSGKPTGPRGRFKYSVIVGEGAVDPTIIIH